MDPMFPKGKALVPNPSARRRRRPRGPQDPEDMSSTSKRFAQGDEFDNFPSPVSPPPPFYVTSGPGLSAGLAGLAGLDGPSVITPPTPSAAYPMPTYGAFSAPPSNAFSVPPANAYSVPPANNGIVHTSQAPDTTIEQDAAAFCRFIDYMKETPRPPAPRQEVVDNFNFNLPSQNCLNCPNRMFRPQNPTNGLSRARLQSTITRPPYEDDDDYMIPITNKNKMN